MRITTPRRVLAAALAVTITGLGTEIVATPAHAGGDPSANIVGGRDATEWYPWMASIQQPHPQTGKILHYCGGSLIRADAVLTAGHCGIRFIPGTTTVRVGASNWTEGGSTATVARIDVHPGYTENMSGDDIAILHLDRTVPEEPITIAQDPGTVGDVDRVIGYGATCDLGSPQWPCYPKGLQEADLRVVDDNACSFYDRSVEVCVKGDNGEMACFADSGGPLVRRPHGRWELIGATRGDGDADQETNPRCSGGYGIWTDATKYRRWISTVTERPAGPVRPAPGAPGHTHPVQPAA